MTNDVAIFCTIAAFEEDKYIERLLRWVSVLSPMKADLFAISDGEISLDKYECLNNCCKVIPLPISLGRGNANNKFPGYRRSFGLGLWILSKIMGYKHIVFLENDSKIVDYDAFSKLILSDDEMLGGSNIGLKGVDSCAMVLNNVERREELAKHYLKCDNIFEDINFEHNLESKFKLDKTKLITKRVNRDDNVDKYKGSGIVVLTQCAKNYVIGKNNNVATIKWRFLENG